MKKICALLFLKFSHCFVHLDQQGQGNKVLIFASSPSLSSPPSPRRCLCLCHRLVAVFACAIASSLSLPVPSPRRCLCLCHRLVAVFACTIASSLSLPAPSPHRCLCLHHRLVAVFACTIVLSLSLPASSSSSCSPHRRLRLHLIAVFAFTFTFAIVSLLPSHSPSSHRCLQLRHRLISVFVAAYIFVCGLQGWNNRIQEKTHGTGRAVLPHGL
ncbi:hypothetical protein OUZ56_007114 [Daphnia magna]|uniref:Uncharacterized protein n=1 Tax=Daphnia magna TaxID=35525 RepID=A0ABQ9YXL8_9CRUS|nr:hypothetical protein OUZ56_007114 [Daphnia magna]